MIGLDHWVHFYFIMLPSSKTTSCLAVLALASNLGGSLPAEPAAPPNIIFIMVDDLGYGDLGVYGQPWIQTPRLDQMAEEGMRFTDVYAGSPICAPARSSLMTGQHTGTTRVRGNFGTPGFGVQDQWGNWRVPLEPSDITIANVLQGAGYVTGITGKWGLGEPGTGGIPNAQGFDEWYGMLNQRQAHSHFPAYLWDNETQVFLPGNTGTTQDFAVEPHYAHDLFTDFALDFIARQATVEEPFFLYLPYTIPHTAYQIPALEPYVEDQPWSMEEKVYASMVTRMDRDVGRILDLLDERGIGSETIVFFCSDNGAAHRYDGVFDSSGPLRGRKRDLYDGGIRTVMIARWPGTIPADTLSDAIWYFPDVLPTLAELAGVPPSPLSNGVSVVPALLGLEQPELAERPLYWEFHEGQFAQAIRRGPWKAVRQNPDEPIELYAITADPGETVDLAGAHPEVVAEMAGLMISMREPSPIWPTVLDDGDPPVIPPGALFRGWLPFDDGAGTVARDHAGLGGTGTLRQFSGDPWGEDAGGGFLDFSTNAQAYVEIQGQYGADGATPRTVIASLRTTAPGAIMSWGRREGNGKVWVMRIDPASGALRVEVQGGFIIGSTVLTDGQWHQVAAVFDPVSYGANVNQIRLYVNGARETISASQGQVVQTLSHTRPWIGGENEREDMFFPGQLRHLYWFGESLDEDRLDEFALFDLGHGERWRRLHFPHALPAWESPAPHSGQPILWHYASGHPLDGGYLPMLEWQRIPENNWQLMTRRSATADVIIRPEWSSTPAGPWNAGGNVFTALPPLEDRLRWQVPFGPATALFARIVFELPVPGNP